MLKHTFQHIHGIGEKTERRLWAEGVTSWEVFLDAPTQAPLPQWQRDLACFELEQSFHALERCDARYFTEKLASALHWRLFPQFGQRIAYVDIETTGAVAGSAYLTVIGVYDGVKPRVYVRGKNLADFVADIDEFTLLVTYNGKLFDLPFLRQELGIPLAHAHIDLRYPLAALGYKGGLKRIEQTLGLEREGPVALLDGWCAILLWQYYEQQGETEALETLLRYNLEDVVHLPALLALVYNTRIQRLPFDLPLVSFPPPPALSFGFSESLIYRTLRETGRMDKVEAAKASDDNNDEESLKGCSPVHASQAGFQRERLPDSLEDHC
ncbi:MAG: ribonuclease H-like domain-containing protein [Candidatus Binatia bacterium]